MNSIGEPLTGYEDLVFSLSFSPDGKMLVSGRHDRTVRLWNATTGNIIGKPLTGHEGAVIGVSFSPDGKTVVSGSDE